MPRAAPIAAGVVTVMPRASVPVVMLDAFAVAHFRRRKRGARWHSNISGPYGTLPSSLDRTSAGARHMRSGRCSAGWTVEGERVKRRLAAVLAADVAGYSRL